MTYVTGKMLSDHIAEINNFLPAEATPHLLAIIHAEIKAYGDALRFELHNRLESTIHSIEDERMQTMTELELRITKAIDLNTRLDTLRLSENRHLDTLMMRWTWTSAIITLVNLIAIVNLYLKAGS